VVYQLRYTNTTAKRQKYQTEGNFEVRATLVSACSEMHEAKYFSFNVLIATRGQTGKAYLRCYIFSNLEPEFNVKNKQMLVSCMAINFYLNSLEHILMSVKFNQEIYVELGQNFIILINAPTKNGYLN